MKDLILTKHAKQRISEYGLDLSKVLAAFAGARRVKIGYVRKVRKSLRYGNGAAVRHYYSAGLIYTVGEENPDEPVLITVTPKERSEVKLYRK